APRVEDLPPCVPVRSRRVSEAESRGEELDLGARAPEPRRQLVVVLRREGRRVAERDVHRPRVGARVLIRSWNVYHGRSHPPGRRAYLEAAVRLATADRPDVLCLQELPLWSLR